MYQERSTCVLLSATDFMAPGCGVDSTVRLATRSGNADATAHAVAPPQSCPTMWAFSAPATSSRAIITCRLGVGVFLRAGRAGGRRVARMFGARVR